MAQLFWTAPCLRLDLDKDCMSECFVKTTLFGGPLLTELFNAIPFLQSFIVTDWEKEKRIPTANRVLLFFYAATKI